MGKRMCIVFDYFLYEVDPKFEPIQGGQMFPCSIAMADRL